MTNSFADSVLLFLFIQSASSPDFLVKNDAMSDIAGLGTGALRAWFGNPGLGASLFA